MKIGMFLALSTLVLHIAGIATTIAGETLRLQLDSSHRTAISPNQLLAIHRFLADAQTRLPKSYSQTIDKTVVVQFKQLDSSDRIRALCSPSGESKHSPIIYGATPSQYSSKRKILLHSGFIEEIEKGPENSTRFPCKHPTGYALALATLLHELTHVYDGRRIEGKVAEDLRFLSLTGWKPVDQASPTRKNYAAGHSPDAYEFYNPNETLAVNMEYFLLDPEFACRRPALYDFLKSRLQHIPFPDSPCASSYDVIVSPQDSTVSLDPARIYEIHLLHADRGQSMASRWGHSMFRVIQCASDRKQIGPECLEDVQSHIVLSFRAHISEPVLNSWKGLTGAYPSQLFALTFLDVVREYTRNEFRNLISLPLKLSDEEKQAFIKAALERFWSYRGKYYFFSNNCASESLDLLKSSINDLRIHDAQMETTPNRLLKHLHRMGYIDQSLLADQSIAVQKGYFFESKLSQFQNSLRHILAFKTDGIPASKKLLDHYGIASHVTARSTLFDELLPKHSDRKILTAHFIVIEDLIQGYRISKLEKSVIGEIMDHQDSELYQLLMKQFGERQTHSGMIMQGARYGVPLQGELKEVPTFQIQDQSELASAISRVIESGFAEDAQELRRIYEFRKRLLTFLRDNSNSPILPW